jgi:hypothetical protein
MEQRAGKPVPTAFETSLTLRMDFSISRHTFLGKMGSPKIGKFFKTRDIMQQKSVLNKRSIEVLKLKGECGKLANSKKPKKSRTSPSPTSGGIFNRKPLTQLPLFNYSRPVNDRIALPSRTSSQ